MSRTYKQRGDDADLRALVRCAAARRSARKLAQLAWGDAAIADQDYRPAAKPRAHA